MTHTRIRHLKRTALLLAPKR